MSLLDNVPPSEDGPPIDEMAPDAHGLYDGTWDQGRWREMTEQLVADGLVTWREIATTILGELNPSQVGTSIASANKSKFGFKRNHETIHSGESFMPYVIQWFYAMSGRCADCGTRLDLQADHVDGRENYEDPMDADWLANMTLRCRRHNVAKRKSHMSRAGRTLLPAQQALMWILMEIRPVTNRDFARLCRIYGMTMAGIRFDEAWAMAVWLERDGHYRIAHQSDRYDVLMWEDNAVTRRFASDDHAPAGSRVVAADVPGDQVICLLASRDGTRANVRYFEYPLAEIPFVYNLDDRPATDIAIWPNQLGGTPLPPRGEILLAWALRSPEQAIQLALNGVAFADAPAVKSFKAAIRTLPAVDGLSLIVS